MNDAKDSATLKAELKTLEKCKQEKRDELRDALLRERGVVIGCRIRTRSNAEFVVKNATLSCFSLELQCVPILKDGSVGIAHRIVGEYDDWKVVCQP